MYIIVHINDKNIYQNTCIHRQNFTKIYIKYHVSIDKVLKYISKYIDPYTKCGWSCHQNVYNINVSVYNVAYAISKYLMMHPTTTILSYVVARWSKCSLFASLGGSDASYINKKGKPKVRLLNLYDSMYLTLNYSNA